MPHILIDLFIVSCPTVGSLLAGSTVGLHREDAGGGLRGSDLMLDITHLA